MYVLCKYFFEGTKKVKQRLAVVSSHVMKSVNFHQAIAVTAPEAAQTNNPKQGKRQAIDS